MKAEQNPALILADMRGIPRDDPQVQAAAAYLDQEVPEPGSEIECALRQQVRSWRALGCNPGSWLMEEFVLRQGKHYPGRELPDTFRAMPVKQCFENAQVLMRRRKHLTYCEGYVLVPGISMLVHHGWCIDGEGAVVDPTLRSAKYAEYFGFTLTRDELRAWKSRNSCSVLDTMRGVNIPFMLSREPSLGAEVPDLQLVAPQRLGVRGVEAQPREASV